jgi:biotin carboxyl carrier protein
MKYFAKTSHKEFEFSIVETDGGYEVIDKSGKRYSAKIEVLDSNRYSLLLNNESFIVNSSKADDTYTTIIRGKQIEVVVDDEKSKVWKEILTEHGGADSNKSMVAPMPGLIVKILVEKGQEITKNSGLFILSAMKMENEIKSPIDGKVKDIFFQEGQSVEKNNIVIELE